MGQTLRSRPSTGAIVFPPWLVRLSSIPLVLSFGGHVAVPQMRIVVAAVAAVAIVVVLSCRRRPLILLCRSNTAAPSPSCSSVTYPYRRRCRRCRHRLALGIVHRGFIDKLHCASGHCGCIRSSTIAIRAPDFHNPYGGRDNPLNKGSPFRVCFPTMQCTPHLCSW